MYYREGRGISRHGARELGSYDVNFCGGCLRYILFTLHTLRATHVRLVRHVNKLSLWLNCSAAWLCIDVSKDFHASYFLLMYFQMADVQY